MITSLSWIPRGAARSRPVRYELSQEEYIRVKQLASQEENELNDEEEYTSNAVIAEEMNDEDVDTSDLPAELRMDEYDNDDYDMNEGSDDDQGFEVMPEGNAAIALDTDSEDEDAEDDEIRPTDTLMAVAITEDEYSHMEIHLLTDDGNLYVHHDITLPEFPLCVSWLDCPPHQNNGGQSTVGNYIAVGTFDPAIEIWNLDVLDPLEPTATLGGKSTTKKKKGKKSAPAFRPGSHTEGVMGLSWNRSYRQALASGSADNSVKIWDVTTQNCSHTFTHHKDKVQSVQWHAQEAWLLATGSFDRSMCVVDCRTGGTPISVPLSADVESIMWDPFNQHHLLCSMENGRVLCADVRKMSTSCPASAIVYDFQAHDETVTGITASYAVPGLFATSSVDQTIRIWDLHAPGGQPKMVSYKTMNVGQLFAIDFCRDEPFMMCSGGDAGMVAVWDCDEQQVIKSYFSDRQVASIPSDYAGISSVAHETQSTDEPMTCSEPVESMEVSNTMSSMDTNNSEKKKKKKKSKKHGV